MDPTHSDLSLVVNWIFSPNELESLARLFFDALHLVLRGEEADFGIAIATVGAMTIL